MRLHLLVPLVLVAGAGVALAADPEPSAPPQAVSISASSPEQPELVRFTCHQESDIGSMRMHKVCTKVPTEAERVQVQDAVRNGLPNNGLTHPAIGDPTYKLMGQTVRH
jgi:hypothetical protein